MKNRTKKMTAVRMIAMVIVVSAASYAQTSEAPADFVKSATETRWVNIYSQEDWTDHWPKLIGTDSDGYYVVGESNFRRGEMAYDRMLWVWRLDNDGQRLWSKPLIVAIHDDPNKIGWDSNFVCLKNERVVLANETGKKAKFRMIRFDESGQVTFNKKLEAGGYSHVLRNIVPVQGGYLIAGWELKDTKNTNAFVMKINPEGGQLWQKIYDRGKSEDAISITVDENDGFTLAANSGQYNKFGAGPSEVWIVKCDEIGDILAETVFPGRHPTIAVTHGGHYAVSYNVEDFPSLDMHITGFDEKLNKMWTMPLYKGGGLGLYKIGVDKGGNFIVSGSKSGKLWLWKISNRGKLLWDTPANNKDSIVHVESMLVSGSDYILAGSASGHTPMPRDENNKHREDVQWDIGDILVSRITEINDD